MTGTSAPRPSRRKATAPRLLVLTDRRRSEQAGRRLVDTVAAAVTAGAPAVLLREKDLPDDERRALATELVALTARHDAQLFVASDAALARAVSAHGAHLAAGDPWVDGDGTRDLVVGRSCHDAGEVAAAVATAVDYVTVSPVAPTASKPGYGPALGEDGVARLAAVAGDVPVLALGGVSPDDVGRLRAAGAHGVAVMGAVMAAADPATVVARLLHRLTEEDAR